MTGNASNPMKYFGKQVRKARLAHGWTMAELGQRAWQAFTASLK